MKDKIKEKEVYPWKIDSRCVYFFAFFLSSLLIVSYFYNYSTSACVCVCVCS